jgi:hypothetical protein
VRYLIPVTLALALSVPAHAFVFQHPGVTGLVSGTISGWVVDANSWLGHGARGEEHRSIASASACAGTPLVILTDDGSVVYPVQLRMPDGSWTSNRLLVPYADRRVTVTGKLVRRGEEKGIAVEVVTADREPETEFRVSVRRVQDTTIAATVTDLNSWLGLGLSGPGHRAFAQARARTGQVLVLIGDDGGIIYPVAAQMPSGPVATDLLIQHAQRRVQVRGTLAQRGPARAIFIRTVSALEPDQLGTATSITAAQPR